MCDPLTIAGAALSAGSAVANNAAANRVARAQTAAITAERERQAGFNQQRMDLTTQATDRFQDIPGQQEAMRGDLSETFGRDAGRGADMIAAALPRTGSNITVSEDERQRGAADEHSGQQREAMARMRSFGDMFGGLGRDLNRDGLDIATINSFARGSQGALPFELESASMRGQGLNALGDVLGGLGGMAVNAGLSGATPFGIGAGRAPATQAAAMTSSPFPRPRPAGLGGLY